jgi:hypothetical protein
MFNEPLGLPKGSVRALIALIIIIGSVALMFTKPEFPEAMAGVLGMVVTYYYLQREKEDPLP